MEDKNNQLISNKELEDKLQHIIKFKAKSSSIYADNNRLVSLYSKEKAKEVLNEVSKYYLNENSQVKEMAFKENIEIREENLNIEDIKTVKEGVKYILTGGIENKTYSVKKGDTAWHIASKLNMPLESIIDSNKEVDMDKLQIGQVIRLNMPKILLNMNATEVINYSEEIDYDINYETSSNLYEGDKVIKKEGIYGKREVTAQIKSINGIEIEKKILKENIISQPESMVVIKGTKKRSFAVASGQLSNPIRGVLTSKYGRRWGRAHTGIDIGAPKGTLIKASQGGKVTFAGIKSGYGKVIIINHGNGYETYYAHANTIKVKASDYVVKGQIIGTVGTTGRVTGPNLHFEVRKNSRPIDPISYVSY